jgi:hypothetical protein
MKLTRQRQDVRDLRLQGDAHVQDIARRYQRLILMAEKQFEYLKEFNQFPLGETLWSQEKRVLKDAEE